MTESAAPHSLSALSAESPFLRELLRQLRLAREGQSDEALLAPFILDKVRLRLLPLMADPDQATLLRLETFYNAVAFAVQRATGITVSPLIQMHPEGFGRVVLTAGRLVVANRFHREVYRFGFPTSDALAEQGDRLVAEALALINRFPEVVRFGEA